MEVAQRVPHYLVIDNDTGNTLAKVQARSLQEAFQVAQQELRLTDLGDVAAVKLVRLPTQEELCEESPAGMLGDRYRIYLSCADDGTGMDVTNGLPLSRFNEWLNR